MQHLVAYYQNVDLGNVLTAINAVADPSLYVVGTQVRVPTELPFLGGAVLQTPAATLTDMQIQTPSLRDMFYPSLMPLSSSQVTANTPKAIPYFQRNPLPLKGMEQMQMYVQTDDAAVQDHWGLVWLQDGPLQKVEGNIFSIRATASVTLATGSWVNGQITFGQQLPVGDYQIVGMRATGASLIAARCVLTGYPWRPGVYASTAANGGDNPGHRFGESGVLGTFNSNFPPSVDFFGNTGGTSQSLVFDLIKVG